jgi:hypothetical protein
MKIAIKPTILLQNNLAEQDQVNDLIWKSEPRIDLLGSKNFRLADMRRERETGCSPCPDILTKDFGKKCSVMFVSTVYGKIYNRLKKRYDRFVHFDTRDCQIFLKTLWSPSVSQ